MHALDIAKRATTSIATGQPTPLENALLTGTHFWFGTQAGTVVGETKLVTLDGAKVLMTDVTD